MNEKITRQLEGDSYVFVSADPSRVLRVPNPEPGYEYRWLADDPERLSRACVGLGDRPGWELIQGTSLTDIKAKAAKLGFPDSYVDENKLRIRYGRLLLARIPAAEAERRRQELRSDAIDKRTAIVEQYYDRAQRRGIRPFVRSAEEMEDRRRFAETEGKDRVFIDSTRRRVVEDAE